MKDVTMETLHKFFVSLGCVVLTFPFLIYGFALNNVSNYLLEESGSICMPGDLCYKLEFIYHAMIDSKVVTFIFVVFFVIGGCLIYRGIKPWMKLQEVDDREKLKQDEQSQALTKVEIENSVEDDIQQGDGCNDSSSEKIENKYLQVRTNVITQLENIFHKKKEYEVLIDRRIGSYLYDIVLLSKVKEKKNIFYQIHYRVNSISDNALQAIDARSLNLSKKLETGYDKEVEARVIYVFSDKSFEEKRKSIDDHYAKNPNAPIHYMVIKETDITNLEGLIKRSSIDNEITL